MNLDRIVRAEELHDIAYHNDPDLKAVVLGQLAAHREADELVKGIYWQGGKGCAIGCLVHSSDHQQVTDRFGWPLPIAHLVDIIFEGLPNGEAKAWPERIAGAIRPGQDLSLVHWQFMHWLLTDEKVNPGINHPLVRDAVKQCALVVADRSKGKPCDDAAESAAESAESAAYVLMADKLIALIEATP